MLVLAFAFIAGSLISLSGIPESISACERTGGGVCPSCGHKNKIMWYS
jgi:hypothetical protein